MEEEGELQPGLVNAKALWVSEARASELRTETWTQKVEELAQRGITIRAPVQQGAGRG